VGTNHLSKLVESYRLATKQPPPPGHILVHNQFIGRPHAEEGQRRVRAWWAKPAAEYILCACGWRPDLGEHYRVNRPGELVRRSRYGVRPAR
jgi:hypothetical protein